MTQSTHENYLTQLFLVKLNILSGTFATNLTLYVKYTSITNNNKIKTTSFKVKKRKLNAILYANSLTKTYTLWALDVSCVSALLPVYVMRIMVTIHYSQYNVF